MYSCALYICETLKINIVSEFSEVLFRIRHKAVSVSNTKNEPLYTVHSIYINSHITIVKISHIKLGVVVQDFKYVHHRT